MIAADSWWRLGDASNCASVTLKRAFSLLDRHKSIAKLDLSIQHLALSYSGLEIGLWKSKLNFKLFWPLENSQFPTFWWNFSTVKSHFYYCVLKLEDHYRLTRLLKNWADSLLTHKRVTCFLSFSIWNHILKILTHALSSWLFGEDSLKLENQSDDKDPQALF